MSNKKGGDDTSMGETNQSINVQITKTTLDLVLNTFRHMRDVPNAVDYSMQITSSPECLKTITSKLEQHEFSERGIATIRMNDSEWIGYSGFVYYAATQVNLEPEANDLLLELYRSYSDWEDDGFELNGSRGGP